MISSPILINMALHRTWKTRDITIITTCIIDAFKIINFNDVFRHGVRLIRVSIDAFLFRVWSWQRVGSEDLGAGCFPRIWELESYSLRSGRVPRIWELDAYSLRSALILYNYGVHWEKKGHVAPWFFFLFKENIGLSYPPPLIIRATKWDKITQERYRRIIGP